LVDREVSTALNFQADNSFTGLMRPSVKTTRAACAHHEVDGYRDTGAIRAFGKTRSFAGAQDDEGAAGQAAYFNLIKAAV